MVLSLILTQKKKSRLSVSLNAASVFPSPPCFPSLSLFMLTVDLFRHTVNSLQQREAGRLQTSSKSVLQRRQMMYLKFDTISSKLQTHRISVCFFFL